MAIAIENVGVPKLLQISRVKLNGEEEEVLAKNLSTLSCKEWKMDKMYCYVGTARQAAIGLHPLISDYVQYIVLFYCMV